MRTKTKDNSWQWSVPYTSPRFSGPELIARGRLEGPCATINLNFATKNNKRKGIERTAKRKHCVPSQPFREAPLSSNEFRNAAKELSGYWSGTFCASQHLIIWFCKFWQQRIKTMWCLPELMNAGLLTSGLLRFASHESCDDEICLKHLTGLYNLIARIISFVSYQHVSSP